MAVGTVPAWALGQLAAVAEQITACTEVEPGLFRADLAGGATAYAARLRPVPPRPDRLHGQPLDAAEKAVLTLLARGYEYADIALGVHGGLKTVRAHLRRAYRKLGAINGVQAVALAIATGQLPANIALPQPPLCTCGEQECVYNLPPNTPAVSSAR